MHVLAGHSLTIIRKKASAVGSKQIERLIATWKGQAQREPHPQRRKKKEERTKPLPSWFIRQVCERAYVGSILGSTSHVSSLVFSSRVYKCVRVKWYYVFFMY
jgi:hypothetical protein